MMRQWPRSLRGRSCRLLKRLNSSRRRELALKVSNGGGLHDFVLPEGVQFEQAKEDLSFPPEGQP